jgi:dipeptide transport system ATP-binding protein
MIAMALACNPKLLIADEPTTALDVTIQAQILNLLLSLQRERGMAMVLITHNMGVVAQIAHRVAVMYSGQVMEENTATSLFAEPQHPYTAALLAARPESRTSGRLATIPGAVPSLAERPPGCLFSPRCKYATPLAVAERPDLVAWKSGHLRCHYPLGDPTREARIAADRSTAGLPEAVS